MNAPDEFAKDGGEDLPNGSLQVIGRSSTAHRAGDHHTFVVDRETGRVQLLPEALAWALGEIKRFKPIEEHAAYLTELGWGGNGAGSARAAVDELNDRGLLLDSNTFIGAIADSTRVAAAPPPVTTIAWPTRNRLPALARSISGWAQAAGRNGRALRFLVADDSDQPLTREGIEGALSLDDDARRAIARLDVVDAAAKRRLAAALVDAGVTPSVVEFALFDPHHCGDRYGANRNAVLLAAAGECLLSADDDTECRFAFGGDLHSLRLFSFYDPTNCRFHASEADVDADAEMWTGDPFALHESLLGRSVSSLIEPTDSPNVRLVTGDFAHRLGRFGGSVAATLAGSWGDSGMGASRMILDLRGSLREHLASPEAYDSARGSRWLMRVAAEPTVSEGPFFMGMHFGVDATSVVPPFFPVKTDEDGLWGILLRASFPDRLVAHLPIAVSHRPMTVRTNDPGRISHYEPRFAELLRLLVHSCPPRVDVGDRNRLVSIGEHLLELSRLPWTELRLFMFDGWAKQSSESIDYLEEVLLTFDRRPRQWADDVDAYIGSMLEYAEREDFGLPYDIRLSDDPADAEGSLSAMRQRFCRLLHDFGSLLVAWPAIFELASERNRAGSDWLRG